MKEKLLKLADLLNAEAKDYRNMHNDTSKPQELRSEWLGVAKGLERAAIVLTAEAWHPRIMA